MMKRILALVLALASIAMLGACAAEPSGEATEPKETGLPMNIMQKSDPFQDDTLRILMIGNSFCFYYVEELYELFMEKLPEGIKAVEIYNLYYSGCKLDQHLNWWKTGAANYQFYRTDMNGRTELPPSKGWTLENALRQGNWDYISYQGGYTGISYLNDDREEMCKKVGELAAPVLEYIHQQFPLSKLLWHRTWFLEVGYTPASGYVYKAEDEAVYDEAMKTVSEYMCGEFTKDKDYELTMVSSGPAWTKARELNETANVLPYGGLCARLGKNSFGDKRENAGDGYHDGDIGGAQLLNAYVWFMTITGERDLSYSTYKPVYKNMYKNDGMEYPLSDEHIALLKEAAESVFAE